jgi:hypothetical protein
MHAAVLTRATRCNIPEDTILHLADTAVTVFACRYLKILVETATQFLYLEYVSIGCYEEVTENIF